MNPIDIFLTAIEQTDARTRYYAVQPIFGRLNSSCIGLLTRELRNRMPAPESGVDGYNAMIAEQLAALESGEAIDHMGLTPRPDPMETMKTIVSVRDHIREYIQLPDILLDQADNLKGTIEFLATAPTYTPERIDQLAKQLEESPETIREIAKMDAERRSGELKKNKAEMLEIFNEIESSPNLDFEMLPAELQVKVYQAIEKSVDRQYANALSSALRSPSRMGDLSFFKAAKAALKKWANHAATTNPDMALALVA